MLQAVYLSRNTSAASLTAASSGLKPRTIRYPVVGMGVCRSFGLLGCVLTGYTFPPSERRERSGVARALVSALVAEPVETLIQ